MDKFTDTNPAREFLELVGRAEFTSSLGVSSGAVTNALMRRSFPPSWYEVGRVMAARCGVDCPPELFKQKLNSDGTHANS